MIAVLLASNVSVAQEAADHKDGARDFLLSGMRSEREKLVAGRTVIRGEHLYRSKAIGECRVPVLFDIAFDYKSKLFRHCRSDYRPVNTRLIGPEQYLAAENKTPFIKGRGTDKDCVDWIAIEDKASVVRTPMYDLHRRAESVQVTRLPPGSAQGVVDEWDMRCLGLLDFPSLVACSSFDETLDAYGNRLKCIAVNTDESKVSRLIMQFEGGEYEIWIDEEHGMTPIRISQYETGKVRREMSSAVVGWKHMSNTWVPNSMRVWESDSNNTYQSFELLLEWLSVNEPLDPKLFTASGLVDAPGSVVADTTLGTMIIESVVPKTLPDIAPKPVAPKPSSGLGWIVLGHLIAGGVFSWWYSRRKSRSQTTGPA